jgi:hypothetical protein
MGNPVQGRGADNVFVNNANGNLVIQNTDEIVIGQGPDAIVSRVYNSQGTFAGETDNWLFNQQRSFVRSNTNSKQLNQSGSKLTLTDWDGTQVVWDYSPGQGGYVSTQIPYTDDLVVYTPGSAPTGTNFGTGTLTWTDGKTGLKQVFRVRSTSATATGVVTRLESVEDVDGNKLTYAYQSTSATAKLTSVTTTNAAGQTNVTPADAYFGRAPAIIQQRERIKRHTIEHRRPSTSLRRALQHRKLAA